MQAMPKTTYRITWENLKTNKSGYQYIQCYPGEWKEKFEKLYPAEQGYIWLEAWDDDKQRLIDFQDPIHPADIAEQRRKDYEIRAGVYDYNEEE